MGPGDFTNERARRFELLASLKAIDASLKRIAASDVRNIGVYGRYRGTFTQLASTDDGTESARVAVSVLHTGRHYADDLSADSLIYHYPQTGQPGLDRSDIDAGKSAQKYKLPVFIVLYPTLGDSDREVRVGYVVDADDASRQFLIHFSEDPPEAQPQADDAAFAATVAALAKKRRMANVRANDQAKFAFEVAKRYGVKCAVCEIRVSALLDAAHIIPVSQLGSDDPRNGLPLCKNHHRAFDAQFFSIADGSFDIMTKQLFTVESLGITEVRVSTASGAMPHASAVSRCNALRAPKDEP